MTTSIATISAAEANRQFSKLLARASARDALTLVARHDFRIWDALVVGAAAEAGCVLLLSEHMQDGFTWRHMTIANPFALARHPLLVSLLG